MQCMGERNVWAIGGSQNLQERQSSMLTNQCLVKETMLSEELILPDATGQRLIYSRLGGVRKVPRHAGICLRLWLRVVINHALIMIDNGEMTRDSETSKLILITSRTASAA
jgi:hypothetical protein